MHIIANDNSAIAINWNDENISYGELQQRVENYRRALPDSQGQIIALCLNNSPDFIALYLACWCNKLIPMPVNPDLRCHEIVELLKQADSQVLVLEENHWSSFGDRLCEAPRLAVISSLRNRQIRQVYSTKGLSEPELPGEDVALILHTSGTSALPKAVMISGQALQHIIEGRIRTANIGSDSKAVIASSLYHSVGLYQCLAYLKQGAQFALLEGYDVAKMTAKVNEILPTHLIMVVEAFERLLGHPDINSNSFANIRFACIGADKVTESVQKAFFKVTQRFLSTSYGMTELSWIMVNRNPADSDCLALGSPTEGVDVKLIDSAGKEVARGEVGEIIASSPKMMTGYWRSWGEDDLPFIDNKWIKTGDLACRDSNGLFWFMGRRKDIIVLPGGDNISPLEIESHILRIPGVKSCIVAAIPAGDDLYAELAPEEPHAFIVSDIDYSQQQILERLRPLLSNYKLPRKVHFVAEIPRGSSRKISRRLLLDWLVEQEQAG